MGGLWYIYTNISVEVQGLPNIFGLFKRYTDTLFQLHGRLRPAWLAGYPWLAFAVLAGLDILIGSYNGGLSGGPLKSKKKRKKGNTNNRKSFVF